MRATFFLLAALCCTATCDSHASGPAASGSVGCYNVAFKFTWVEPPPVDIPEHFSPVVIAAHSPAIRAFELGEKASGAIETQAETGNPAPLVDWWKSVGASVRVERGATGIIERNVSVEAKLEYFCLSSDQVMTLTSMIAPSPDFFIGVTNRKLYDDGEWVDEMTLNLDNPNYQFDAGTDKGKKFNSTDVDETDGVVKLLSETDNDDKRMFAPAGTIKFYLARSFEMACAPPVCDKADDDKDDKNSAAGFAVHFNNFVNGGK